MGKIKAILQSRKIFYCFLFIFFIITALYLLLDFYYQDRVSCFSGPFYKYARWDYKIAINILNSNQIGILLVYGWVISLVFLMILGFFQRKTRRGDIAVLVFFIAVLLFFFAFSLGGGRVRAKDARRQAELSSMRVALENYYTKNKKYPGVSGSNQWDILSQALGIKTSHDPFCYNKNPKWDYEYWVSSDGQKYVLKANLQNPYLSSEDLDGNILGASCGENGPQEIEYCISSSF